MADGLVHNAACGTPDNTACGAVPSTTSGPAPGAESNTAPGASELDARLLDGLTPEQKACVMDVSGALVVSAGAGSGKTFMLTRRIAYALAHPELSGVSSLGQILAITFTNLAASEIKKRVRDTLRSLGMNGLALQVDASDISTIHSACNRILKEHALALGLDPGFALLGDTEAESLRYQALTGVLADAEQPGISSCYALLSRVYAGKGDTGSLNAALFELLDKSRSVPGGLDSLCTPSGALPVDSLIDLLLATLEELPAPTGKAKGYEAFHRTIQGQAPAGTLDTATADGLATAGNAATAGSAAASGLPLAEELRALKAAGASHQQLADILARLELGPRRVGTEVKVWSAVRGMAAYECLSAGARPLWDAFVQVARAVDARYRLLKQDSNMLDQDDLLTLTLQALDSNPGLRASYQDRFRLVMIDEFQDTNAVQVAIADHLCGAGRARLCTVGDAMQSIYRFRGADVATYAQHTRQTVALSAKPVRQLTRNFRSHPGVISFVNRLFRADPMCMALDTPAGSSHRADKQLPGAPEAVDVLVVDSPRLTGGASLRVQVCARQLRRHFEQLHKQGTPWSDMVILLRGLNVAPAYANELRAHGIPCIIAGGSGFKNTTGAATIRNLALALANPYDDVVLKALLSSAMFGLNASELQALSLDGKGARQSLWTGLRTACPADSLGAGVSSAGNGSGNSNTSSSASSTGGRSGRGSASTSAGGSSAASSSSVILAASVLTRAVQDAGSCAASKAIELAVLASGWLDRLHTQGAEGAAEAANVLKALRLVSDIEQDASRPLSVAGLSQRLAATLDAGLKEQPGTLNTSTQDAVRIMTVHASKGLEFPVVAVGAFESPGRSPFYMLQTSSSGIDFQFKLKGGEASLCHQGWPDLTDCVKGYLDSAGLDKLHSDTSPESAKPHTACLLQLFREQILPRFMRTGAFAQQHRLRAGESRDSLAETRRLLYVACTRAEKQLLLLMHSELAGKDSPAIYASAVLEDLRHSLLADGGPFMPDTRLALPAPHAGGHATGTGQPAEPDPLPLASGAASSDMQVHIQMLELSLDDAKNVLIKEADSDAQDLATWLQEDAADSTGAQAGVATQSAQAGVADGPGLELVQVMEPLDIQALLPAVFPARSKGAGVFSYSSISAFADHKLAATPADPQASGQDAASGLVELDPDELYLVPSGVVGEAFERPGYNSDESISPRQVHSAAVAFGSAFHAAAQWMIEQHRARKQTALAQQDPAARPQHLEMPSQEHLRRLARTWDVPDSRLERLRSSLERWCSSALATRMLSCPELLAENPIYTALEDSTGEVFYLNGSADLLGFDPGQPRDKQTACLVDYKTGGSAQESPEQLHSKHLLQAICYAYAMLDQGFSAAELHFVRVEIPVGAQGQASHRNQEQPQVVSYRFEAGQKEELRRVILGTYARARAAWQQV